MDEAIQTPSDDFSDTLITGETNPLEPDVAELKYYAAGTGLIQEEDIMLQRYGFIDQHNSSLFYCMICSSPQLKGEHVRSYD